VSVPVPTVDYEPGVVHLLDQTLLPDEEHVRSCRSVGELIEAIRALRVRGAPAIGVAAAHGVTMAADRLLEAEASTEMFIQELRRAMAELRAARPTAVNLMWAIDRMSAVLDEAIAEGCSDSSSLRDRLAQAARHIHEEDVELCRRMGENGAALLAEEATVLTHCNTGSLATAGIGTALGVVYAAVAAGKRIEVLADETRPLLQGARLTAWELHRAGIPVTVLADGAAGWALRQRKIDAVIVGADRIAANGDVANKIGTYSLAVLARRHGVPFYVVAPYSTLDLSLPSGEAIPIELRDGAELTRWGTMRTAPEGVAGFNPAFDVTPAELISAIVTEHGVFRPPYDEAFRQAYR